MLLSLEKKFIFIHIPKTAGSSITRALRPVDLNRSGRSGGALLSHLPVPEAPEKANLSQHDKAAWLRRKLPGPLYDSAYKFAVVRNPSISSPPTITICAEAPRAAGTVRPRAGTSGLSCAMWNARTGCASATRRAGFRTDDGKSSSTRSCALKHWSSISMTLPNGSACRAKSSFPGRTPMRLTTIAPSTMTRQKV